MSRRVIKSLASSEISVNSSSSKFHWHARMLFRVSLSSSPRNGDKPLRLLGSGEVNYCNSVCLVSVSVCVSVCVCVCMYVCVCGYQNSQHVSDDP